MRFTSKILPSRKSNLGIIELNNAPAFHALTLDMVHCMNDVWDEWTKTDQGLKAILIKSSSCKRPAFCAGGDVKAVWKDGMNTTTTNDNDSTGKQQQQHGYGIPGLLTSDFFRDEYTLNYKMATRKVPQISLWDGIVMGGGTGISMHGKYRIATENTLFAMPETSIGFFCDVGSLWWMPRIILGKGGIAPYIALTGARLRASDLLYTGLATHCVPSEKLNELEIALAEATRSSSSSQENVVPPYNDVVAPVLEQFHVLPSSITKEDDEGFLQQHESIIDETFSEAKSVEDIVSKLQSIMDNSSKSKNELLFCQTTLQTLLHQSSPMSLKVTFEGLQKSKYESKSIEEELQMEYRISQHFMKNNQESSDFYRGIRSVLIEKKSQPVQWLPSKLEDVTDDMVQSYFSTSLGEYEWKAPGNNSKL